MYSQSASIHCIMSVCYSFISAQNSFRVSGPSDSGSRSSSGDTGEGELRTGSIQVRVNTQCYRVRYTDTAT